MWSVWLERAPLRAALARGQRGRLRIGAPVRGVAPLPGGEWVRVRNHMAGLGEADLALARGLTRGTAAQAIPRPRRRFLGREVVGRVTEIGPDVTLVQVGDRVVLQGEPLSTCATLGLQPPCRACAAGNPSLCQHRAVPWGGTGAGWGDEMIVHESQLFLVPAALSDDQAVILEPASRAVRAVLQRLPEPGAQALIIGGNLVGYLLAATLRALAPSTQIVLATDLPHERAAAERLKLSAIIPARSGHLSRAGAALTNAQTFQRQGTTYVLGGFDIIYDCLGTGASLGEAVRLAQSGGLVVIVAAPAHAVRLDPSLAQQDEVRIVGVAGAGSEPSPPDASGGRWSSFSIAARMLRKGQFAIKGILAPPQRATPFRRVMRQARAGVLRVVVAYQDDA
jgi:threonine dehydrogenase-like Zn-dependent dehydrogenase